ncbi:MAG TPA: NAD(P)-binding domain-containing protein [Gammaproteobacteria bacterium]|nr:NAD(P)-binding domain-containing protein [Gammaproteobacteria bacterium]
MHIGILGSGVVGQALGLGFAELGHMVKIGSREPANEKLKAWQGKAGKRASTGSVAETAKFADVAVLATQWSGTESALRLAGAENLAGKIVMDVTNPLVTVENQPPRLALGHTDSGGEQVQRWLPQSKVVKAFNSVGHAHMVNPRFPGGPPDMFICGNDAAAKQVVTGFCTDLGWGVVDVGGIEGARLLEPLCILWVMHGIRTGSWNHAFKLLRA